MQNERKLLQLPGVNRDILIEIVLIFINAIYRLEEVRLLQVNQMLTWATLLD